MEMLEKIAALPNVVSLPVAPTFLELTRPLVSRLHGYRQATDALLLGLAIHHNAAFVTFDHAIQAMAGKQFAANILVLRSEPTNH